MGIIFTTIDGVIVGFIYCGSLSQQKSWIEIVSFFFAPLAILIGWSPGFFIVFSFFMDYWIHISLLTLTNVLCIANVSLLCSLNTKNVWSVLCIILPIYRTFSLHNDSPLENWSFANVIKYTEWFYVVLFLGNAFFYPILAFQVIIPTCNNTCFLHFPVSLTLYLWRN